MIIKFKEYENKDYTFSDVEVNQFFISSLGNLCQKSGSDECVKIADQEGKPKCYVFKYKTDKHVRNILPKVTKIVF